MLALVISALLLAGIGVFGAARTTLVQAKTIGIVTAFGCLGGGGAVVVPSQ